MFRPMLLAAALVASPALAAEHGGKIVMTGTASVGAKPDLAIVSAGVMTTADSARTALAENSKRMSQVFAALKDIEVEERDITTSSFNISPNWEHGPSGSRQRGYQVSNQVTVRLRDVTFVGAALDTLVRAGANQAGNVQFVVQDKDSVLDGARAEAVKKARDRAALYANAAGVSLGPILEIVEGGPSGPRGPMFADRAVAMESAAPVAAGEQDLSVSVTITWALSDN